MARTDGKPENHHYVPKMLLRNFAFETKGKEEQVYVYDKHKERTFPTAVSNIAAERGFYEADFGDGLVNIEQPLSVLEDKTKAAFAKLIEHEDVTVLDDEDRAWIAIFIASQHVRVRHFRETVKVLDQQVTEMIIRSGGDPLKVEGFSAFKDEEELKRFAIEFLVGSMKEFSEELSIKAWLLMKTGPELPFWISDNPVTMHNSEDYGPYGNIGLAVKGIQIHLPISSTLTLVLWCPSIVDGLQKAYEDAQRQKERLLATKTLNMKANMEAIDEAIELSERVLNDRKELLDALERGTPVKCSEDNVTFLNALQAQWAHRFVMSPIREFKLVERILKEQPHYRKGIQLKVN